MTAVINAEAKAIQSVIIDDGFEKAANAIVVARGKIVTTGIGKAGHIANKFAATLCSTGTPAVFLHAADAAHGDLGIVEPRDVLVAFSTSGKSREVLELLELATSIGVNNTIGITSHPDSSLRKLCSIILNMGPIQESACPIGLTPTSTIAVMLAISDAIAMAVMEVKGITKMDYGLRHHAGYLGRAARGELL
ncbi:capsule biosynthesis protein [Bradyrhizobium nitroreducens]|uniref:Capsule biosynthesis protein n=1 Tax=Bradyrhizobium nitroreducens TaxID=709803 RepID=A0A2M6UN55_9BRAD|nr:SIS domain-containing protein [Bradyrhizobium nitroreducens]PIT05998.1 capsule biosynthesis protein [Bradyrhizobium nitroreducens]